MEAGHVVQNGDLPNPNRLPILVDPWLCSEVVKAILLKLAIHQGISQGGTHMIDGVRRLACMGYHRHEHGVHNHVSRNLFVTCTHLKPKFISKFVVVFSMFG